MDTVRVQILFSVDTKYGTYSDALYFGLDEYQGMSQDDVDALKQERVDAWTMAMANPVLATADTKAQMIAQVATIDQDTAILAQQKADLQAKILLANGNGK